MRVEIVEIGEEEFRPVVGWPEYMIGSLGTLKKAKTGKVLKPYPVGSRGRTSRYYCVRLCRKGLQKPAYVHRLVLEAFVGPCPEGLEACHNDSNTRNNQISNLRWDTHTSNVRDTVERGASHAGERHPMAKLTADQVVEIRRLKASSGLTLREIGRTFGVHEETVGGIVRGESWKHLLSNGGTA